MSDELEELRHPSTGMRCDGWRWDGNRWVCDWDDEHGRPPFPTRPPGFPPWFGPPSPPWYPGANGGVSFSQNAPKNVIRGHFWWNGTTLAMFDGAGWVDVSSGQDVDPTPSPGTTTGGTAATGTTPPSSPSPGSLWFNGSALMVWNGSAWVPAVVSGPGVTDGSVAAAGMIGEFISSQVDSAIPAGGAATASWTAMTLPPGDWDVVCAMNFITSPTNANLDALSWFLTSPMPTKGAFATTGVGPKALGVFSTDAAGAITNEWILVSPLLQFSISQATPLVMGAGLNPSGTTPTVLLHCVTSARRAR